MEDDDRAGPEVMTDLLDHPFDVTNLVALRAAVAAHADVAGLPSRRIGELVLLVHELASNAVRHGGGQGRLRMWTTAGALHCEVSDDGPGLAGHYYGADTSPPLDSVGGRGIWLVRELCDRVDWRSGPAGTVVTVSINYG
jgi:anti-sigma regulatory factor (Ser/Thr protein kinase)